MDRRRHGCVERRTRTPEPSARSRHAFGQRDARLERLILYLVPSMLTLSVPAGLAIGAAVGLSQRERSRRLLAAIGLVALLSSLASLVNIAWVTPIANQSYRAEVIGDVLVRKGQNELTLTELRNAAG